MGCPVCGTACGEEDRFCRICGFSLAAEDSASERRFVTALFSDLSGYTTLSAILDPEELKSIMDSMFEESSRIIVSLGGMVEKFLGDAVVALFGIHRAHEDGIVRAIRSARMIHALAGERVVSGKPLSMHTGIHSGNVLVDRRRAGGLSLGALGMPINIAARLSGLAGPGEILVDGSAVHEAERFFLVEPLGAKALKGVPGRVEVYRIARQRDEPSSLHRPAHSSIPLVGRSGQLGALMDAYASLSPGSGGQVLITGVPGAGKSRLGLEFLKRLPEGTPSVTVHCLDHMKDIPYHPVVSMLRRMLSSLGEGADAALEDLLENPRHAFHIRFLLGMKEGHEDLMPDVWKTEIAEAVFSLVQAYSRGHTPVVCVEDFHWADATSRDLLLNLAHPESGCLFLFISREGSLPLAGCTRITVEELPAEHTRTMIEGLLGCASLPERARDSLHRITGGNPLYIEEYLSYLKDRGISPFSPFTGDVPSTIVGIISARLDSLGPSCKSLLQAASVLGMIFPVSLLRATASTARDLDEDLETLARAGFISLDATGECSFRHALTREAAYASLLGHRRRELHRKTGEHLERTVGSRGEHCGTIAYHFIHAREYERAYPYCMLAARLYQAEGSWMEAAMHYTWARECICSGDWSAQRDEMLIAVCEGIWSCSRIFSPDRAIASLEELASLYGKGGHASQEIFSRIRLINLYSQKAQFEKALSTFERVQEQSRGNAFLSSAARTTVAYTYTFLGKPLKALEYLEDSRPAIRPSDRLLLLTNHLTTLASCVWSGRIGEALSWYARTKELSSAYLDFDLMAEVWLGYLLFLKGEIPRGTQVLGEVRSREKKLGCLAGGFSYLRTQSSIYLNTHYTGFLDRAREDFALVQDQGPGDGPHAPLIGLYQAWIAFEEGRTREAADLTREVLPSLEQGIANRVPYALNTLSEALFALGDLAGAQEAAERCVRWNTENGNSDQLIRATRILGTVLLARGSAEAGREALRRASSLARRTGMAPHTAWALASWGDYFRATGQEERALACFRTSHTLWESMGCPYQAAKVLVQQAPKALGKAFSG